MKTPDMTTQGQVTPSALGTGSAQWAFASDPESEHWSGPFATKHEAIVEALAHYGDPEDGFKPCVSECRPVRPEDDAEEEWTFICTGEIEVIDFS